MNDPQAEGHMASRLGRRKFLATLGGAAAAWPLAAHAAEQKPVRIGFVFLVHHPTCMINRSSRHFEKACGKLVWSRIKTSCSMSYGSAVIQRKQWPRCWGAARSY